ncbi:MAG: methylmalonyl-CoA mutase [Betaproteobacteria bacterium]|nr:methylmalonyl-CoA mutase [Betaproteobacteria bacterium]
MTDHSILKNLPKSSARETPPRFITAASLFDGHDASISIVRRILQDLGCEVIHLGHNRAVSEIVNTAVQEDAQAIAVSSYQGGHVEFFKFMVDSLREQGAQDVRVFGGGGGVIVPAEIKELMDYGVTCIYSPEDGQRLGLQGMIADMIQRSLPQRAEGGAALLNTLEKSDRYNANHARTLAKLVSMAENGWLSAAESDQLATQAQKRRPPVVGITGTGGAGKSSLTDELVLRFRIDHADDIRIAILSIDPTRRKSHGALLGDRIRMNAINHPNIYMRSLATRDAGSEISSALPQAIECCAAAGFDLIIVETSGIGQGDAAVVPLVDQSLYVMTPEYGAASQLEKIDMLDFANFVAINKFDRRGAEDALRDVSKQVQRNRGDWGTSIDKMPVFGTQASRFNDDGVTALYHAIADQLSGLGLKKPAGKLPRTHARFSHSRDAIIPAARSRYLAEIAADIRGYRQRLERQTVIARELQQLRAAQAMAAESKAPVALAELIAARESELGKSEQALIAEWPAIAQSYRQEILETKIRDRVDRQELWVTTLSGSRMPRVGLPRFHDHGDILRWRMLENLPGYFPFTAGVFPFKRADEDPTRMFAGEGDPARTNRRFKLLAADMPAIRLSTAFDSVTLYGSDPGERPDVYGKVGNSGVSVATLEDMKTLYSGFALCSPSTSVSMTINGPAPTLLAMFFNAAIDQALEAAAQEKGRPLTADESKIIRSDVLRNIRGTVQADILKEDQGQNTCIFSTDFSLKVMGDIQEYFVKNGIRNFYSVSISGYHIAEAGANPISQLAFTLANAFTYVESYLARGMKIDDFAPNLSFFFSNGMDPEYSVLGRVARRVWALAMREKYGANERSQKLKYHIQTSGRSLHAQEIDFNDIRTTLQALIAIYDNCNSLHTNAYDEAITTPTEESVRRAMAIQLIINREWGLSRCDNPNQGSFIIEELTDLVEEAVLSEFERISERGGVLGAMETGYQRGKIQDESMHYEHLKHTGELQIIGVNTFRGPQAAGHAEPIELARSTEDEKRSQLSRLAQFHRANADQAGLALERLKQSVIEGGNVFEELMNTVRSCSLGQITQALYAVGGQYRRNM